MVIKEKKIRVAARHGEFARFADETTCWKVKMQKENTEEGRRIAKEKRK